MLANQHKTVHPDVNAAVATLVASGDYIFDIKWDGVRCIAYIEGGKATLINRRKVNITYRYPEVVAALETRYPKHSMVFDGEIICFKDGLPDFARIHRRDAQQSERAVEQLVKSSPATFMAFDLLCFRGDDLRLQPYIARRALLRTETTEWTEMQVPELQFSTSEPDGNVMWDFIKQHSMEGLIAKTKSGTYRAGRSPSWIKLKPTSTLSAIVSGVDPGEGARAATFGALHLCLLDEGMSLQSIGKVGSGFKGADLKLVLEKLKTPTTPLVIEVEYQEVSPNGQLRFPVFKGIRSDVNFLDCTTDQLA
jgi:bifunctional non-homologous end joining protein LigD